MSSNGVAIRQRAQTTLGFTVSLDPPRNIKHAMAEVRVLIQSSKTAKVSVMNLLPSEKTYNVAKITSNQKAFGAGVAIEAVNIGVATGKSRDRLYLAKDTDTVALQFDNSNVKPANIKRPRWGALKDWWNQIEDQGDCGVDPLPSDSDGTITFGWQFRPVLGADYVEPGNRQVFAQLALPSDASDGFDGTVWIRTVWRYYDPQSRVAGPIIKSTCSTAADGDSIQMRSPLKVHNLTVSDIGGGQLKFSAKGDFYTPAFSIRSGSNNVVPTMFDGSTVNVFGAARDLIKAGDLYLVDSNGTETPFGQRAQEDKQCGIDNAVMTALPYSDGNSRVQLDVMMKKDYLPQDGVPLPLALIGDQTYGLQESPYTTNPGQTTFCDESSSPLVCHYQFLAPTASLQKSQTFFVRDLAWSGHEFQRNGVVNFEPGFSGIAAIGAVGEDGKKHEKKKDDPKDPNSITIYSVTGFGFHSFFDCKKPACPSVWIGNNIVDSLTLTALTDNLATLQLDSSIAQKTIGFGWVPKNVAQQTANLPLIWVFNMPKSEPTSKAQPSPPFLYVGDSQTVTFTGGELGSITSVVFESLTPLQKVYDPKSKSLAISVPTAITQKPGHKELIGKTSGDDVILPIDVVLR
jgi:hypothetical protein